MKTFLQTESGSEKLSQEGNISGVFEQIYDRYWQRLLAFAQKLTGDRETSEQIVQDVFVSLWERRETLVVQSWENYLFKSVKYQIFKRYRDNQIRPFLFEERFEAYVVSNPPEPDSELLSVLKKAVGQLPERRRQIVIMSKMDGMAPGEIASALNLSRQTVKNQLSQALKQLRMALKDYSWLVGMLLWIRIHF